MSFSLADLLNSPGGKAMFEYQAFKEGQWVMYPTWKPIEDQQLARIIEKRHPFNLLIRIDHFDTKAKASYFTEETTFKYCRPATDDEIMLALLSDQV